MKGPCDSDAKNNIHVVLTVGTASATFKASRNKPGEIWVGFYPDQQTFPANRAKASLRLGDFRTDCVKSVASKTEDAAIFSFYCDRTEVRAVTIQSDGPIKVDYVRKSKSCPNEVERQTFKAGGKPNIISDMWIPGEEFRLQLNWDEPNPSDPGLLVFSLDAEHRDSPIFWLDTVSRRLMYVDEQGRPREQKSGAPLPLHLGYVVNTLAKQRFVINGNNSGKARINDDERLKSKLKTLTLAVN